MLNPVRRSQGEEFLTLGERQIPMVLVRNPRARRYVLRLRPDGSARVTIPRGGSVTEARRFAERNKGWPMSRASSTLLRLYPRDAATATPSICLASI